MLIIICNILIAVLALAFNPCMANLVDLFANDEKITFSKVFAKRKFDFKLGILVPLFLVALFYKFGLSVKFFAFGFLGVILIMDALIDIKAQIIPNGLNFICFIVGIVLTYIMLAINNPVGVDMLLGMFTGAGIFLLIVLLFLSFFHSSSKHPILYITFRILTYKQIGKQFIY